ncbi:MAG: glutamyl-tRNA reductase [Proteobacteria bacterium]|nr:glutamyl-tRNA reductase [Pseudomonadota bacterium]
MPFFSLGINHQTAPVEIREKLAFNREQLPAALKDIASLPDVQEVIMLSTCNRTEIYCVLDSATPAPVLDRVATMRAGDDPGVRERFYAHEERDVVRHLLRVASGLDSLVLGEPQILGQLKQAYDDACAANTVGPVLHRLFQFAFQVAKQVRTDTAIGANAVSVAYAAVSLARQIFGDLSSHTALLIGAGETIELAAGYLEDRGLGRMIVANRTLARAQELATKHRGYAIGLEDLPDHFGEADIVISSTASPDVVLKRTTVEKALRARKHKPVFMVDIAVPRDIEASVADLDDVYLYTVDDLQNVIEENRATRAQAAQDAEEIVAARAQVFVEQLQALDAVPLIQDLRRQGEHERDRAMEQARRMLAAGRSAEDVANWLANTLTNRLLHAPTSGLRQAALDGKPELIHAARELFGLEENDDSKE